MTGTIRRPFLVLAVSLLAATAGAQSSTLTLYGMAAQIEGDATLGDLTTEVSVSTESVLENLEMAGMARYRYQTGPWSILFDGVFMGLGGSHEGIDLDIDLTIAEFDAGYNFTETFEGFFGIRYTDLNVELAAEGPIFGEEIDLQNGDTFIDPVLGVRFLRPLSDRWLLQGQADIGGFVETDLQWQAMLNVGFRTNETVSFWLGYRALGQDFDQAGEHERFAMDVVYHGPVAAVAFQF